MSTDLIHNQLVDMAIGCRVLALYGHEDKSLGHCSIRDPEGRGLWLKRAGFGLAEIDSPDDFVLIDFNGKKLFGSGSVHLEWPIHTEIMLARPDVNIVGHTHPFYACLFAATQQPLRAIGHEGCYFNADVPRYRGTSFLIDTAQLGRDLVNALCDHKVVLMNNHGLTFCGSSLAEAGVLGITIEKACKQQLTLAASGYSMFEPDNEEIALKARNLTHTSVLSGFWAYYVRQLVRYEAGHGPLVML
jgi:L-fuculose-phosphate aldolase